MNDVQSWLDRLSSVASASWYYVMSWESVLDLTLFVSAVLPERDYGETDHTITAFFQPGSDFWQLIDVVLPYFYLADWFVDIQTVFFCLTVVVTLSTIALARSIWRFLRIARGII